MKFKFKNGGIVKGQNGLMGLWHKAYDSKLGQGIRNFMFGKDYDLSDEEYVQKYGYNHPNASAGILELLTPGEIGKLSKLGTTLKETERATRVAKEAASAKRAELLSKADDVRIGKSGRTHIVNKKGFQGSGQFEKVATDTQSLATNNEVSSEIADLTRRYYDTLISARNAYELNQPHLAQDFMNEAHRLEELLQNKNVIKGPSIWK